MKAKASFIRWILCILCLFSIPLYSEPLDLRKIYAVGEGERKLGNLKQAKKFFLLGVELANKSKNLKEMAFFCFHLGEVLVTLEEFTNAEAFLLIARKIHDNPLGKPCSLAYWDYLLLCYIYLKKEDYEKFKFVARRGAELGLLFFREDEVIVSICNDLLEVAMASEGPLIIDRLEEDLKDSLRAIFSRF